MAAAAITAPKSDGQLFLQGKHTFMETVVLDDANTKARLAEWMRARGAERRETSGSATPGEADRSPSQNPLDRSPPRATQALMPFTGARRVGLDRHWSTHVLGRAPCRSACSADRQAYTATRTRGGAGVAQAHVVEPEDGEGSKSQEGVRLGAEGHRPRGHWPSQFQSHGQRGARRPSLTRCGSAGSPFGTPRRLLIRRADARPPRGAVARHVGCGRGPRSIPTSSRGVSRPVRTHRGLGIDGVLQPASRGRTR